MRPLLIFLLLVVIFLLVVPAITVHFFGWWGLAGLIALVVGLIWLTIRFGLRILFWIMMKPIRVQAAALRGATVAIHRIESASPPEVVGDVAEKANDEDDEATDEDDVHEGPRDWYLVDATITPRPERIGGDATVSRQWEPGVVLLAGGQPQTFMEMATCADECEIAGREIWRDGQFRTDEEAKCFGPQRLRFHVGVKPDVTKLVFLYGSSGNSVGNRV